MNKQLVEILLSIFNEDKKEMHKTLLCLVVPTNKCNTKCHICPIGYERTTFNGRPHYLKHLIILMDKVNI